MDLPPLSFTNTLYYSNDNRVQELNERLLNRNQPDEPLPPNFDPRPTPTKYTHFPVLDQRMPTTIPIESNFNTSLEKSFAPPVMKTGAVYGFINQVDQESNLRNQYFALQRGADQSCYVPSSDSDMYHVVLPQPTTRKEEQVFPLLFEKPAFSGDLHPNLVDRPIGMDTYHNHTRTQNR